MNYLLKSKPKNENRKKVFLILSFYFFLSLLGFLFGNSWRGLLWATAKPIWATSSFISSPFSNIIGYFSSKNNLIAKNLALDEELTSLRLKEADYDVLLKENQNLKDELGRRSNSQKILSAVLSKPPRSPYDTLLLDVGSSEGVTAGSKVYVGENILVGLVTNITVHTSLVNLFSSGGQKQEAVLSRTGASFTLEGKGGQNFQLEVPKDTDILWGDAFVYPGVSQSVLANVYYIDTSSQGSFKTIYLRIPTNVFSSKYVFVQKSE